MFLLIRQPGLKFYYNNIEYTTPIEIEFDNHNLQDIMIKLRSADILDFVITPTQSKPNKSRSVKKIKKINDEIIEVDNHVNEKIIESISNLHKKMDDIIDNISSKNINESHVINKTEIQKTDKPINKKSSSSVDMFIPDIELDDDNAQNNINNIKTEKNESNQEDSANYLRKLLNGVG